MTGSPPFSTIGDLLLHRAEASPDVTGYIFLRDGDRAEARITYGELARAALAFAGRISDAALPGDRALLTYEAGLDFVTAFFGCALAGIVAVPTAPPTHQQGHGANHVDSLARIATDCSAATMATSSALAVHHRADIAAHPALGRLPLVVAEDLHENPGHVAVTPACTEDLAYLQYTSGSTSSPRGVRIRHSNVLANAACVQRALRLRSDDVAVTWLPHFHDMGLGGLLYPMYAGHVCVAMSPMHFLVRPPRWLRAISNYGGTWSGGPNSAFELLNRWAARIRMEGLDLNSLKVLLIGAEPIHRDTLERFIATFAPAGLSPSAVSPAYGLAESVVFVSGARRTAAPTLREFDDDALRRSEVVATVAQTAPVRSLVGCGPPGPGYDLAIVDPETRKRVGRHAVGEVWIRGPSVAAGYWADEVASAAAFGLELEGAGPYLRTGDLGFVDDGELYITGRIKDVIIVGGRNHYPQDIEATVEDAHDSIRPSSAAAFCTAGPDDQLVVTAEIRRGADVAEVVVAIRAAVSRRHQLALHGIGLMAPRSAPKTSSGKIRRHACRNRWLGDDASFVSRWVRDAPSDPAGEPADAGPAPARGDGQEPQSTPGIGESSPEGIAAAIAEALGRILGRDLSSEERTAPLVELGLSSLELVDLRLSVIEATGVAVPLSRLLNGWSVHDVTSHAATRTHPAVHPIVEDGGGPYERLVNPSLGRTLRALHLDRRYVRGRGCWLYDESERAHLDLVAGYGAVPFGHGDSEVWAKLSEVREREEPNFIQGSELAAAGELAERLIDVAPPGLGRVTFVNSGAEATEAAIKLVRSATGRRDIVSTHGGFHGKTLGALSATGRPAYQTPFGAPADGFRFVPYGDSEALDRHLAEHLRSTAGVILEPIQGEAGVIVPRAGYLRAVREICTRHGVAMIVDEIQTGLGRTGALFACDAEEVTPDVLLLSKALGGGLVPVGAVVYHPSLSNRDFDELHSSTFAGNTLGCRAGLATIELLVEDERRLIRHVQRVGEALRSALEELAKDFPQAISEVRGRGLMLGLQVGVPPPSSPQAGLLPVLADQGQLTSLIVSYLANVVAVRVAPTILSRDVIRVQPPLVIDDGEVAFFLSALRKVLSHVGEGDTSAIVRHLLGADQSAHIGSTVDRGRRRPPEAIGAVRLNDRAATTDDARGLHSSVTDRWAFLGHIVDDNMLRHFDRSLGDLSTAELARLTTSISSVLDPFVAGSTTIHSAAGVSASGDVIVLPVTPQQLLGMPHEESIALVQSGVDLAAQRGARVVGLGGYTSVVTGGGIDLPDQAVTLTTGNTYTALTAAESLCATAAGIGLDPSTCTVAVVGAGGSVGRGVAMLLAERAGRLVLIGNPARPATTRRTLHRLASLLVENVAASHDGLSTEGPLLEQILSMSAEGFGPGDIVDALEGSGRLKIGDAAVDLAEAELVVTTTSSLGGIFDRRSFRPGTVVCDVSRPLDVRADDMDGAGVLVIEGGLVQLAGEGTLGVDVGLPVGTAYACMCEPMILALEGAAPVATTGVLPSRAWLDRLSGWATRHGFRVAPVRGVGLPMCPDDLDRHGTERRP